GVDPLTGKKIYVATDRREKNVQRALLQWKRPENAAKVREAANYCSENGKARLDELLGRKKRPAANRNKRPIPKKAGGKRRKS
ncbi:MAG: YgiQ family radical SAM protein, partial [Clostridia bacterium]|nr:YgiQ family radical SAM protein [Clostridia bacterium]